MATSEPAGFRTHALAALAVASFTIVGSHGFGGAIVDQSRITAGVVTGIGLIGAGAIVREEGYLAVDITAAASIWTVAAIGMRAAAGLYLIALATTLLALLILFIHPKEN